MVCENICIWMENQSDTLLLLSHWCVCGSVPIVLAELLYYFWCNRHTLNPKHHQQAPQCNEEYVYVEIKTDERRE